MGGSSHWTSHAEQWALIGPPLRPCPADVEFMQGEVAACFAARRAPLRALLLGVTPELVSAPWQPELDLVAVDRSAAMIRAVWPGETRRRRALRGEWLELPLPSGSIDLVLGDGCLTLLDFPRGYAALTASLARVLRPGGCVLLRLFCRPARAETVEDVCVALRARSIGNFHAFKWRLAMALQGGDTERGVALADVWDAYRANVRDDAELASETGFRAAEVGTIHNYRGVSTRYTYSTLEETLGVFASDFELINSWCGSYELAERCPTVTLRRR